MTDDHAPTRPVATAFAPPSPRRAPQPAVTAGPSGIPAFAVPALNHRDVEVLAGLAQGRSTSQIASHLAVSRNTARTRIRRVQGKLDVTDRAAAVRAAQDLGILLPPGPRRSTDG